MSRCCRCNSTCRSTGAKSSCWCAACPTASWCSKAAPTTMAAGVTTWPWCQRCSRPRCGAFRIRRRACDGSTSRLHAEIHVTGACRLTRNRLRVTQAWVQQVPSRAAGTPCPQPLSINNAPSHTPAEAQSGRTSDVTNRTSERAPPKAGIVGARQGTGSLRCSAAERSSTLRQPAETPADQ